MSGGKGKQRMSKKYIIEIEDEPLVRKSALHGEDAVYRVVGFKSLVFDQNGLDKLVDFDMCRPRWFSEAYEQGMKDAWAAARRIVLEPGFGGLIVFEVVDIFGTNSAYDVLRNFEPQEAIERLKAYDAKHQDDKAKAIEVGDEVICDCPSNNRTIVVRANGDNITIMRKDGACYSRTISGVEKTGRHFDEIEAVLKKLQGDVYEEH